MYVLIYICHLLHIYLSRNVDTHILIMHLNAYFATLFRRKFIALIDNYIFGYLAIILSSTFNLLYEIMTIKSKPMLSIA